ncbi:hypothetical protein MIMGU_mgv1a0134491mg, partial [Erythranthe guttata]
MAGEDDFTFCP